MNCEVCKKELSKREMDIANKEYRFFSNHKLPMLRRSKKSFNCINCRMVARAWTSEIANLVGKHLSNRWRKK